MKISRIVWRREGKIRSDCPENRDFRDSFGCGEHVHVNLWTLIQDNDEVLDRGEINHML